MKGGGEWQYQMQEDLGDTPSPAGRGRRHIVQAGRQAGKAAREIQKLLVRLRCIRRFITLGSGRWMYACGYMGLLGARRQGKGKLGEPVAEQRTG